MADIDAEEQRTRAEARRIRKGDRIRVVSGVFAGEETEVVELKGTRAKIKIRMFAADHDAEVSLRDVDKVA